MKKFVMSTVVALALFGIGWTAVVVLDRFSARSLETGPPLESKDAFGELSEFLLDKQDIPQNAKFVRGREDFSDGRPLWMIFTMSQPDFEAVKKSVKAHYSQEKRGAPFEESDYTVTNVPGIREKHIVDHAPDWWKPFGGQSAEVLCEEGEGVWLYLIYVSDTSTLYVHCSKY